MLFTIISETYIRLNEQKTDDHRFLLIFCAETQHFSHLPMYHTIELAGVLQVLIFHCKTVIMLSNHGLVNPDLIIT